MIVYVLKRLALMLPTLFLILLTNFAIVQIAPTGPVERQIAKINETQKALTAQGFQVRYQGQAGLSDEMIQELNVRFGFDEPAPKRFWLMVQNYARFELGQSFFKGQSVASLIGEKLPMSMMFGTLTLFTMYVFGVLFGILKARFDGTLFDRLSAVFLAMAHAVPVFMVSVLLLVLFAGSRFWQIFPLQVSFGDEFVALSWFGKLKEVLYQFTLPVMASSLSGIASIAYLTKFSIQAQLTQGYVKNATAQGLSQSTIIKHHVLKNALLPIMSDMPMAVVGVIFAGNFLVEVIFGIDGLGRLGYEAVANRDYPVMFGVLYVFTLVGIVAQLVFDVLYHVIDPRVNYR